MIRFLFRIPALHPHFARQAAHPTGMLGRWMARTMNEGNARMSERAVDLLEIHPGDHVLEIGFGGGPALRKILTLTGREGRTFGLERSATMIGRLHEPFAQYLSSDRLRLIEGDAERLQFPDNRFDGILTANTIYFWPDPQGVISGILRVLKPGRRLVLAFRPRHVMERIPFTWNGFTLYEPGQVRALFERAGFEGVRLESSNDDRMGYVCVVGVKPGVGGDGVLVEPATLPL